MNFLVKVVLRVNEVIISCYINEFFVILDFECLIDVWWIWESLFYIMDDFIGIEFIFVEIFGVDDIFYVMFDD